ncbi:hypothetical protein [Flavobacterium sp.]|uniref:hypothetical protein n=1 Tax=Flavobacterium sp. TaxID=239 RepID=UPI0038CF3D71
MRNIVLVSVISFLCNFQIIAQNQIIKINKWRIDNSINYDRIAVSSDLKIEIFIEGLQSIAVLSKKDANNQYEVYLKGKLINHLVKANNIESYKWEVEPSVLGKRMLVYFEIINNSISKSVLLNFQDMNNMIWELTGN